jgi:hypothetical protein
LIIAWCSKDVQVEALRTHRFSASVKLKRAGWPQENTWWLTAVYGHTVEDLKPVFLHELSALCATIVGPWAVAANFNIIVDARNKNNTRLNRRSMDMFRRCINDLELRV